MSPLFQQVLSGIAQLTAEARSQLIEHIQQMQSTRDIKTQSKETGKDPLIGLFAGSPDLATQSEEILHHNLTTQGWTWKQSSQ
ncbi:hypothetical protein ACQ4M3_10880 [Leptolyngbya sp. AN03gr2]|uniref:hypothetical protein n=1 Tax=unclassified Leptolyngbya TaxID=2650499 RepID=UPI003D310E37